MTKAAVVAGRSLPFASDGEAQLPFFPSFTFSLSCRRQDAGECDPARMYGLYIHIIQHVPTQQNHFAFAQTMPAGANVDDIGPSGSASFDGGILLFQ